MTPTAQSIARLAITAGIMASAWVVWQVLELAWRGMRRAWRWVNRL